MSETLVKFLIRLNVQLQSIDFWIIGVQINLKFPILLKLNKLELKTEIKNSKILIEVSIYNKKI